MRLRSAALVASVALMVGLRLLGLATTGTDAPSPLRAPSIDESQFAQVWNHVSSGEPLLMAPGLPATVGTISFPTSTVIYPVYDAAGMQIGWTKWRVVAGTGNCCENHLGSTKTGRLMDFGGDYLNYSDDRGVTWRQVRPQDLMLGAEGTVVTAPGGDILGVTWDPYTGDRVLSYKMDGATGAWSYAYSPLHTPFYDREWIAVIPGPHTIAGQTVPYISVIRGGVPKSVWSYSLDGLHYTVASVKMLTALAGGATSAWLPTTPDPEADWTQAISEGSITPLNGGGALARSADPLDNGNYRLAPGSLLWSRYTLGDGSQLPPGRLVMDSRGWSHVVDVQGNDVSYALSRNGGRTWETRDVKLPPGHTAEDWDLRANGALGVTAVAIHAHNGLTNTDQDLVLRFATLCGSPELVRTHKVGLGNVNASSGITAAIRFDFATTALLSDGKVATSILDSAHLSPAVAVEGYTTYKPGYEPPLLSCGVAAP